MGGMFFRRVGVIADDFTGAGDVALAFEAFGFFTEIWTSAGSLHPSVSGADVRVWILDTESRGLAPQAAARAVANALGVLSHWKPDFVFKKIDSTLRGPVSAELAAFVGALRPEGKVPFVPAFPKMGRTTVNGRHFVDGVPLHQTAFGKDPRHPVRSNRIEDLLQPTTTEPRRPNNKDNVLTLSPQPQNMPTHERVWVPDVENDLDLAAVARKVVAGGGRVAAGSAGFAWAIAREMAGNKKLQGQAPPSSTGFGPVGVVVGSAHPLAAKQTQQLKQLLPWAGVFLLESPSGRGSPGPILRRLVNGARELETAHLVRRWVVTGGETAFALARFWKECRWRVVGMIEPSVPLCRSVGRRPRFLVLKPGGFGSIDVLLKAVRFFLKKGVSIGTKLTGHKRQRRPH